MNNKRATKRALLTSVMALVMCVIMLVGTTFAWFTDTASTGVNKSQAGNLDVKLMMLKGSSWVSAEGETLTFKTKDNRTADKILWEPGCTYKLPALRIDNRGNLALKYKIIISGIKGDAKLNEAIEWKISDGLVMGGIFHEMGVASMEGVLYPSPMSPGYPNATNAFVISGHMREDAGNEYKGLSIEGISITVVATQYNYESDSFGSNYDKDATYPALISTSQEMINALKAGGTVTVGDITLDGEVDADGNVNPTREMQLENAGTINLRLDGKVISGNISGYARGCMRVMPGTKLVVSAGENGKFINTKTNSIINVCGGDVVVNSGYFESEGYGFFVYTDDDAANAAGMSLTINGGTFKANWGVVNVVPGMKATVAINGGTFIGWDPTPYVNAATHTVTESNGTYTVTAK